MKKVLLTLALLIVTLPAFAQTYTNNVLVEINLISELTTLTASAPFVWCRQNNTLYYYNPSTLAFTAYPENTVLSVNTRTGAVVLTKADVGLTNADNTSDANKPVSTAQQTALNLKANIASPTFTGTVSGIDKTMVGLSNVPNTDATNATNITSGTLDGDRLPTLSTTKKGGVPATGAPTGKFLRDDATWVTIVSGGDLLAANNLSDLASIPTAKTNLGLNNVDNTSDATKNAASVTLTNKTISGANNTITNIAQSSVTNLTADLAAKLTATNNLSDVPNKATARQNLSVGYALQVQALTSSPVDASTIYFGNLPKAPTTTINTSKIFIRQAGVIRRAEIYCFSGTAGTAEAWPLSIRLNGTTDTAIATVSAATSGRIFSNTGLSITVAAGDYIEIKSVNPTWVTNPLTTIFGGYIFVE